VIIWLGLHDAQDEFATLALNSQQGSFLETRVSGSYIPQLAIYDGVLCALSFFTRYYPHDWLRLYNQHTHEFSIVRAFIDLCELKLPVLALNELANRSYVFH